ncbi:hypothetical protein cyc_02009 [Cyclospora cayetanensis]|uniref:Uncharacterized protein n=1 Tax=Cyclospora cayetanensis TaxID=88456 RepID=A0A1D3CW71_9EIME|nr:hypothetical protein cyc_02009 [Cyclospora cayetanensis]
MASCSSGAGTAKLALIAETGRTVVSGTEECSMDLPASYVNEESKASFYFAFGGPSKAFDPHDGERGATPRAPCCIHLYRLSVLQQHAARIGRKCSLRHFGSLRSFHMEAYPGALHEEFSDEATLLAAAEQAIRSSLWEQGITPLRDLMELCSIDSLERLCGALTGTHKAFNVLGCPGSFSARSRIASPTYHWWAPDVPAFMEGVPRPLPSEDLPPLHSMDSQAIRYHLLPLSLLHKFSGAYMGSVSWGLHPKDPLPQIPLHGRANASPPLRIPKKRESKGKALKKGKKSTSGALEDYCAGPTASNFLPRVQSYWEAPLESSRASADDCSLKNLAGGGCSARQPFEEPDESILNCSQGVFCLEGTRVTWLEPKDLAGLLRKVGGSLRCLSLGGSLVQQDAEAALGCLRALNLSGCLKAVNKEKCVDRLSVLCRAFPGLLSFSCAGCTELSAQALQAFLSEHQNICCLNISLCCQRESDIKLGTSIQDDGLMLLARRNCTQELKVLDVRGCVKLSILSLEFILKRSPLLSIVYLEGLPKLTEEQTHDLRTRYSMCKIYSGGAGQSFFVAPAYRLIDANETDKTRKPERSR